MTAHVSRLVARIAAELAAAELDELDITTAMLKASEAMLERRITVMKRTPDGLALECQSARSEARYLAAIWRDEIGLRRSCTCPNGDAHPVRPRCWHVAACDLLAGLEAGSDR